MKYLKQHNGRSTLVVGQSEKGPLMQLVEVDEEQEIFQIYGDGELVRAACHILESGAERLRLIKIDYSTEHGKYQVLNQVYELIEGLDIIDNVLVLGVDFAEFYYNYPDWFNYQQSFYIREDGPLTLTVPNLKQVEYIKIDGKRSLNYSIENETDTITINADLIEGQLVEISCEINKLIEVEVELMAFKDSRVVGSETIYTDVNLDQTGTIYLTDQIVEEYFTDQADYYTSFCPQEGLETVSQGDGSDRVILNFDYETYRNLNTQKRYFLEDLAEFCQEKECLGLVETKEDRSDGQLVSEIYDLINSLPKESLPYLTITYSQLIYQSSNYHEPYFSDSGSLAVAQLLASAPISEGISNYTITNVDSLAYNPRAGSIRLLTQAGFTVIKETVRNGYVPHHARTLDEDLSVYNMRIINLIAGMAHFYNNQQIGRTSLDEHWLYGQLESELSDYKSEDVIIDYEIKEGNGFDYVIELTLYGELRDIKYSIHAS